MLSKLIVALDVEDQEKAIKLVDQLADITDIFKVGLQLFTAAGPDIVKRIMDKGVKVFLDLKLHDIPNTVAKAVESGQKMGVLSMTLHVVGGREMLLAAAAVQPRPQLWGVSVLTSLNDDNLKQIGYRNPVKDQVGIFAKMAKDNQLDGIICSPREISLIRPLVGDTFTIVTPGVRVKKSSDDQKRTMSAAEAVKSGADFIVVGRPVLEAADVRAATLAILKDIGER
ncbi:MAG: orotidine-5'-phosphate decarboxylase [bacterium]|nr:orotidine-5'-phosphate decarboxylase [bacterium]MDD5353752.1 orotidine-5'-phosphate decarboxylase [bacterium]MDD5755782.1 orotidine-5'-phosphate decarboxylase [bacterium]